MKGSTGGFISAGNVGLNVTVLAVAIGLASCCTVWAEGEQPKKHLIAKWDFDGDGAAIAVDRSGNGHKGILGAHAGEKELPKRVDGMAGKAMEFSHANGTEIRVKNAPALNPTKGLTVAAWIKHEGAMAGNGAEIIGKRGSGKNSPGGYRLFLTKGGRLYLRVGHDAGRYGVATARRSIQPNHWYHVAGTFSPGRLRLYVNGRLAVENEIPTQQITPTRHALVIGNFAGRRNNSPFNGLIDEVCLFDIALDAEQIFQIAQEGERGK